MTREEAVDRLCTIYQSQFDITRCQEEQQPLAATMDFYATSEKYVLSKKAKLWEAKSFEYVYLFSVPHLTKAIYDACEKLAYEQGMARIQPGPTHMYTYITTLFVCLYTLPVWRIKFPNSSLRRSKPGVNLLR